MKHMKHWIFMIDSGASSTSVVGMYGHKYPSAVLKKITCEREEAVLISEYELDFSDNIQRFFLIMAIVYNGIVGMSTDERRNLGFYFQSDYEYLKRKGHFYKG